MSCQLRWRRLQFQSALVGARLDARSHLLHRSIVTACWSNSNTALQQTSPTVPSRRWRKSWSPEFNLGRRYVANINNVPYEELTIGIPKETFEAERRVALTPQNAALLLKKGFGRILVEKDAGIGANFPDVFYEHV